MSFETLYGLDLTIVVFVTNHIDMTTTHFYGRKHNEDELYKLVKNQILKSHGEDALEGFEILSIVK